ncbi:MAG: RraA family protein, partial [Clostridia bacterium]|nr:RraA family protein [Clostridia bacterium]
MRINDRETVIRLTPLWKGERFPDGRPKVPQKYLDQMRSMTLEELWKPIYLKGYESQFEGDLKTLHDDGRKLIGRAVTASYVPTRPDLLDVVFEEGREKGFQGNFNQWVIDSLVEGDVVVVDMYDKIYKGTFLGGNLTTAIKTRSKTGGGVVWGGIRDVEQMKEVPDVQVYYRGIDPTPIREFVMKDFNSITRIGKATVLPGDIVYGAGGGVLFIPSHLVQEVVEGAAKTHVKDDFGFEMISAGKFTTAQIDRATWTEEML